MKKSPNGFDFDKESVGGRKTICMRCWMNCCGGIIMIPAMILVMPFSWLWAAYILPLVS